MFVSVPHKYSDIFWDGQSTERQVVPWESCGIKPAIFWPKPRVDEEALLLVDL